MCYRSRQTGNDGTVRKWLYVHQKECTRQRAYDKILTNLIPAEGNGRWGIYFLRYNGKWCIGSAVPSSHISKTDEGDVSAATERAS